MKKKEVIFSNYKIPDMMLPFVKVQDALSVLDETNVDDVKKIITTNITTQLFHEELVLHLIRFSQIRSNSLKYYAQLTKDLISIFGENFREILYTYAKGLFLRSLYQAEVFNLDEIRQKCKLDISQYFFFAPELDIPKEAEEIRSFGPVYTRLGILRRDNWQLYKELLENGYEKNTLRYALKFDDVNFLEEATKALDWTYSKRLFPSPFEPSSTMSLLSFAARHGSMKCFNFLLEKGMKIDQEVVDSAIASGNMELFSLMRTKTNQFRRALVTASRYYHIDIADWLLLNTETSDVFLDNLIESGNYRIVTYFASPADISYSIGTWTPLSRAAVNGFLSLCIFFMANGAQVNPMKSDAFTPLHAAAQSGYLEVCRYFLSNGANINPKDDNNNSPLYLAAQKNNYQIVDYLLSKGAPINQGNEEVLFNSFIFHIFFLFLLSY